MKPLVTVIIIHLLTSLQVFSLEINYILSYIRPLNGLTLIGEIVASPSSVPYTVEYVAIQPDWMQRSRYLYIPTYYKNQPDGYTYSIRVRIRDLNLNAIDVPVYIEVNKGWLKFKERPTILS